MADHEYSVVGHSRAKIGMLIAAVAGAVSGALGTLAGLAATYLSDRQVDVPDLILWPLTGTVIFGMLFDFQQIHLEGCPAAGRCRRSRLRRDLECCRQVLRPRE